MENRRLCESDYRFMDVIWSNEPVASMKLVELCQAELGWKKSTTFTMLRKLCEKGFAQNEQSVVTALVSREEVQKAESERFVEQTFSGSLPGFLVSFLGGKTISHREAEEIKRLIDSYQEEE
ncbi:MAG: BlaI/MecI/CopY family transcriptional regulator [Oscillospiraceae bacterium]|nr:BlaI/MecI/CopY family transcriptional regulator [Oscillospiraceae bacterium]MBR1845255.1 BlaI/MecI/CopY family transcriptional regulator [Oscillospiraceae bacterium]